MSHSRHIGANMFFCHKKDLEDATYETDAHCWIDREL